MWEHKAHKDLRVHREQMLYGILLVRTILVPLMPLVMLPHIVVRLGIALMQMGGILAIRP